MLLLNPKLRCRITTVLRHRFLKYRKQLNRFLLLSQLKSIRRLWKILPRLMRLLRYLRLLNINTVILAFLLTRTDIVKLLNRLWILLHMRSPRCCLCQRICIAIPSWEFLRAAHSDFLRAETGVRSEFVFWRKMIECIVDVGLTGIRILIVAWNELLA